MNQSFVSEKLNFNQFWHRYRGNRVLLGGGGEGKHFMPPPSGLPYGLELKKACPG